jgi:hypothetical protein
VRATREELLHDLARQAAQHLGDIQGAWSQDFDANGCVCVQAGSAPGGGRLIARTNMARDAQALAGLINVCIGLVGALAPPAEPQETPHE